MNNYLTVITIEKHWQKTSKTRNQIATAGTRELPTPIGQRFGRCFGLEWVVVESHGSSEDVAALADQIGCGQLLLDDHVGPLTPEGPIGGETQLTVAQGARVAAAPVDAENVVLRAFVQIADGHVKHHRHHLHLRAAPAAAAERHRRTLLVAHCRNGSIIAIRN